MFKHVGAMLALMDRLAADGYTEDEIKAAMIYCTTYNPGIDNQQMLEHYRRIVPDDGRAHTLANRVAMELKAYWSDVNAGIENMP